MSTQRKIIASNNKIVSNNVSKLESIFVLSTSQIKSYYKVFKCFYILPILNNILSRVFSKINNCITYFDI